MYVYIYIYIYTCMYTYIYIYMYMYAPRALPSLAALFRYLLVAAMARLGDGGHGDGDFPLRSS